ncbi:hypothetical protein BZG36_05650 [Bifiguratus adelaidae]|uniref:Uncharacterized protein n=1 Tax=Bifiguratus adelaidae TaxID=1938954 RepID=A0A261XTN1_9FUNG|nr:hypothetical protein BZG36_05650 [Bifiguratus adelaidae]
MDIKQAMEREAAADAKAKFKVKGERIYAICYRKVRVEFVSPTGAYGRAKQTGYFEANMEEDDQGGEAELVKFDVGNGDEEAFVCLASGDESKDEDDEDDEDDDEDEE